MGARDWDLFVDEAGGFKDATDPVVVGGLLLPCSLPEARAGNLLQALRELSPALPWPLHASYMRIPVFHALGLWIADGVRSLETNPVLACLRAYAPEAYEAVEVAQTARSRITVKMWWRWDDVVLLHDPDLHARLKHEVSRVRAGTQRILKDLRLRSEVSTGANCGVAAFMASESRTGDAAAADRTKVLAERYGSLLDCLVDRTVQVMERRPDSIRIFLHALTRDVWEPVLGQEAPLHVRHLGTLLSKLGTDSSPVQFLPGSTPRFDPRVHPALVLSDLVVNRARMVLAAPTVALRKVEARLTAISSLAVRSGNASRSHLAATGCTRDYIEAERQGPRLGVSSGAAADALNAPGVRRWAREQALEWARP